MSSDQGILLFFTVFIVATVPGAYIGKSLDDLENRVKKLEKKND